MGTIVALLLLIFTVAAVPLFISLIYKYFYDNHVNNSLSGDRPLRKWLSPISLFVLMLLVEFFLVITAGVLFRVNTSSETTHSGSYTSDNVYQIMTQDEIDQTVLSDMNGAPVKGYELQDYSQGDISCQVYTRSNCDTLPSHVIRVSYTGTKEIGSYFTEISYDTDSAHSSSVNTMSDYENPDRPLYILLNSSLSEIGNIEFTFALYPGNLDDYSTGNLGTYDMPDTDDSDENITFVLP